MFLFSSTKEKSTFDFFHVLEIDLDIASTEFGERSWVAYKIRPYQTWIWDDTPPWSSYQLVFDDVELRIINTECEIHVHNLSKKSTDAFYAHAATADIRWSESKVLRAHRLQISWDIKRDVLEDGGWSWSLIVSDIRNVCST